MFDREDVPLIVSRRFAGWLWGLLVCGLLAGPAGAEDEASPPAPKSWYAATIARGDAYGKCALVFKSPLHAQLAFDTLAGPAEEDTSGRPQKKIYLDDGGGSGKRPYCKVRPF